MYIHTYVRRTLYVEIISNVKFVIFKIERAIYRSIDRPTYNHHIAPCTTLIYNHHLELSTASQMALTQKQQCQIYKIRLFNLFIIVCLCVVSLLILINLSIYLSTLLNNT